MKIEKINVKINQKPESKKVALFIDQDSVENICTFDEKPSTIKIADGYAIVKNHGINCFMLIFNGADWYVKSKRVTGISFKCDPELTKQLKIEEHERIKNER